MNCLQTKLPLPSMMGPMPKILPRSWTFSQKRRSAQPFFVVGERVPRFPSVIARIFNEGHLLANHSQTHTDLAELTNEEIIELELDPTSRAVKNITGFYPTVMRPPPMVLCGWIPFISCWKTAGKLSVGLWTPLIGTKAETPPRKRSYKGFWSCIIPTLLYSCTATGKKRWPRCPI